MTKISQGLIISIGVKLPNAANAMQDLNFIKGKIFGIQILDADKASFCDTIYVDGSDLVLWLEQNNLPQSLSSVWRKDKRANSVRLYSNNEIVTKHNYRRNEQLSFQGETIVCYISIESEVFRDLVSVFNF